jgi:hypothetical protein
MRAARRTARDLGRLGSLGRLAGTNAAAGAELALVANRVVAGRMALAVAACLDPLTGDHAELSRMVPEKAAAFSDASMLLLDRSQPLGERIARYAAKELTLATGAALAMARCRTPASLAAAQASFAVAWAGRAFSLGLASTVLLMRSQGTAMAPISRVAEANLRRLRR